MGNNSSASTQRPPPSLPQHVPVTSSNKPLPPLPDADNSTVPFGPCVSSANIPKSFSIDQVEQELAPSPARQDQRMEDERKGRKKLRKPYREPGSLSKSTSQSTPFSSSDASNGSMTALPRAKSELNLLKSFGKRKVRTPVNQPLTEVTEAERNSSQEQYVFPSYNELHDRSAPQGLAQSSHTKSSTGEVKGSHFADIKSRSSYIGRNHSGVISPAVQSLISLEEEEDSEPYSEAVPQYQRNLAVRDNFLHSPKAQRTFGVDLGVSPRVESEDLEPSANSPKLDRYYGDTSVRQTRRRHSTIATTVTNIPFMAESELRNENDDPFINVHQKPDSKRLQPFGKRFATSTYDLLAAPRAFFDQRRTVDSTRRPSSAQVSNPTTGLTIPQVSQPLPFEIKDTKGLSEAEKKFLQSRDRGNKKDETLEHRKEIVNAFPSDWPPHINREAYLDHTTQGTEDTFLSRSWKSYKDPLPSNVDTSSPTEQGRPGGPTRSFLKHSFYSNQISGLAQHGNVMEFAAPPSGSLSTPPASELAVNDELEPPQDIIESANKPRLEDVIGFSSGESEASPSPTMRDTGVSGYERSERRRAVYIRDSPIKGNFDPESVGYTSKSEKAFYASLPADAAILLPPKGQRRLHGTLIGVDEEVPQNSSSCTRTAGDTSYLDELNLYFARPNPTFCSPYEAAHKPQESKSSAYNDASEPFSPSDPSFKPNFKVVTNKLSKISGLKNDRSVTVGSQNGALNIANQTLQHEKRYGKLESSPKLSEDEHFWAYGPSKKGKSVTTTGFDGSVVAPNSYDSDLTLRQSLYDEASVRNYDDAESGDYIVQHDDRTMMYDSDPSAEVDEGVMDGPNESEHVAGRVEADEIQTAVNQENEADGSVFSGTGFYYSDDEDDVRPGRGSSLLPILNYPDDEEPFIGTPANTRVVSVQRVQGGPRIVDVKRPKRSRSG